MSGRVARKRIGKAIGLAVGGLVVVLASGCQQENELPDPGRVSDGETEIPSPYLEEPGTRIDPANWHCRSPAFERQASIEQEVARLLSQMSLEEKVGQVIQADIGTVTPDDVREFKLGSVLNGGGSAPENDLRIEPAAWLALADRFWEASTDRAGGRNGIPVIWGTDAVHGHNNILGATIFPHNIGLGAANDPDLLREIGRITALEIRATGMDWTFAPTVAVARNDRWGRTHESYSEDPQVVAALAPRLVEGLQGMPGSAGFLGPDRVLATAKHFLGDGGTFDGIDQGDNRSSESELRDIHGAGYPPSIAAGVQTVMASFNSFHGRKLHGYEELLNGVLVDCMGFDGFVVGDWNGHGQVEGCSNDSCPASFNAGLDMFMAPNDWEALYHNTLAQVRAGEISPQRLDQAVGRILRVKLRAGVMDAPRPSEREHAGDWSLLGSAEHRAVAREAVRKSLVLLKNEGGLLPLPADSRVLVSGAGAHDIGMQSGGWTLSWQGTGNARKDFPNGTSIFEGLAEAIEAAGGVAVLSPDGRWQEKPDAAIVVFGEEPYAEGVGDLESLDFEPDNALRLLRRLHEQGIPTVGVFLSGRPLWVNPELNASDAFVAAWLPGTEGSGVADVLIAGEDGRYRFDFTGRLPFSWPATAGQAEVNVGDPDYAPLFALGYGLAYGESVHVPRLPEESGPDSSMEGEAQLLIATGKPVPPWQIELSDEHGQLQVIDSRGASPSGTVTVLPRDHLKQEDTLVVAWDGQGSFLVNDGSGQYEPVADRAVELEYRVLEADLVSAELVTPRGRLDLSDALSAAAGGGWQTHRFGTSCSFDSTEASPPAEPFRIRVSGQLLLQVSALRLVPDEEAEPGSTVQACGTD